MRVIRSSKFEEDLDYASRYLNEQESELGKYFIDEVEAVIQSIVESPLTRRKVYRDIRRMRLRRFKAYSVLYQVLENEGVIQILSVIHGARDPNRWQDRRL